MKSSKGKICGGYTTVSWSRGEEMPELPDFLSFLKLGKLGKLGKVFKDNSSFLFSVSNKTKYPIKKDENAVWHHDELGFCFNDGHDSCNLSLDDRLN